MYIVFCAERRFSCNERKCTGYNYINRTTATCTFLTRLNLISDESTILCIHISSFCNRPYRIGFVCEKSFPYHKQLHIIFGYDLFNTHSLWHENLVQFSSHIYICELTQLRVVKWCMVGGVGYRFYLCKHRNCISHYVKNAFEKCCD